MSDFEEMLILEVESHECLYNKRNPDYKNRLIKNQIWEGIATILDTPTDNCKAKWKNLRDTFFQILRTEKNTPSGSGATKKTKWQFYDCLYFLIPFFDTPRTLSNITRDTPSENGTENELTQSADTRQAPKPKSVPLEETIISLLEKDVAKENPPLSDAQMFLQSLVKRFENLNEQKRSYLQIKILELFHNVEFNLDCDSNIEYCFN